MASDPDGEPLHYTVLYLPDGGNAWLPLAQNLVAPEITIDSGEWAGSDSAQIRVLASDGWNTTAADSAVFRVTRKAPHVWILNPDNMHIPPFEAVILQGHGEDMEDGELDDDRLTWVSDRKGVLGKGSQLILSGLALSPGRHTISLTGEDSHGRMASAQATVWVGYRVYLPTLRR
jgi:hypothetical protein